jgi:ferritin-like metal-binding protein YciE
MKLDSLRELLVHELEDLHDAERQMVKALPKMAKAASFPELRKGFERHLEQTKEHVKRLETAFQMLGANTEGKKSKAMAGIIREGQEIVKEPDADEATRDAGLISAAQRVEHYEIAGYGTARAYAKTLNEPDVANLLQTTLSEETETDKKLTQLAEQRVNPQAAAKAS